MRASFLAAVLLLLLSSYVFGQTSNATVGGTVSDATGALIPGVTIKATNTATGIVTMVFSNEAGAYQFASLQTGAYTLSAELPGFQTQNVQRRPTRGIAASAPELHVASHFGCDSGRGNGLGGHAHRDDIGVGGVGAPRI